MVIDAGRGNQFRRHGESRPDDPRSLSRRVADDGAYRIPVLIEPHFLASFERECAA
jgi:hypothetical protein